MNPRRPGAPQPSTCAARRIHRARPVRRYPQRTVPTGRSARRTRGEDDNGDRLAGGVLAAGLVTRGACSDGRGRPRRQRAAGARRPRRATAPARRQRRPPRRASRARGARRTARRRRSTAQRPSSRGASASSRSATRALERRARRARRSPAPSSTRAARARSRAQRRRRRSRCCSRSIEDQLAPRLARSSRQVEEETKRDAERRVRSILSIAMQRLATSHAAETTVSVVQLPRDDMKGRIIGREGRNIRALETLTGVDFIIDDTPNAVVLSGFDGVRREIARITLERLLQDGRIHPARIEETYYQAKSELEAHIAEPARRPCSRRRPGAPSRADQAAGPAAASARATARTCSRTPSSARSWRRIMRHELGASAEDRAPRRAAARHRQGRDARDRGPARAGRRRAGPPPRRARGRRPRDGGPPRRGRAADRRGRDRPGRRRALRRASRVRAASRWSSTSSGCATSSRSRRATTASTRSTRCRPAARSA